MAEKISVQIALEGGAEIERQLADIGAAGQKAFVDISKSAEEVGGFKQLDPKDVTAKLQEMGITGVDAIDKIQKAVQTAGRLESIVQGVQAVENGFAAAGRAALALAPVVAGIGVAFAVAAKSTIAFADAVTNVNAQALKLGTGIEKFDQLRLGLEKAGISAQGVTSGLENFQRVFGSLEGLPRFIEQLRQMPDSAQRSAAAIKAFGQVAGPELIQALRTGSIGVDQFVQKQGALTQAQADAASKLEQSINQMKAAWSRLGSLALSQTLTDSVNLATSGIEKLNDALKALQAIGASDIGKGIGESLRQSIAGLNEIVAQAIGGLMQGMQAFSPEQIKAVQDQIRGVAQASQEAGQAAAVAGVMFTQWGTLAGDAGNIAAGAGQQGAAGVTQAGQAAAQAGIMFTQWGTVAQQAGAAAAQAGQQGATAGQTAAQGAQQATSAWDQLLAKLREFLGLKAQAGSGAPTTGGGATGNFASGGLLGGRGSGTSDSNLAWVSRGEHIMPARVVQQPGVLAFLEALRRSGGKLPGFAGGGLIPAYADGGSVNVRDAQSKAVALYQSLVAALQKIQQETFNMVDKIAQVAIDVGESMDGVGRAVQQSLLQARELLRAVGLARGGLIGGRGSGTSDSNLAWVSRGEYVTPARAVSQPGVLAFLEALRRSGGNLSRVLDGMGRFALGGLVPRPMPAFAAGGLAGGMSNVTIQFPGLPAIGGLRASSEVVDELRKAAALAQVRSGGRKPSRYS